MYKYNLHPQWTYLIDWTSRMTKKYGATVKDKCGEKWDWGQAMCRELYGEDWSNSVDFLATNDIPPEDPPPQEMVELCKRWESGEYSPEWWVNK